MEETRGNRVRRGAIFVAVVFGIMSFVGVAPTWASESSSTAESSSIFSGAKPFQPINIQSAALDGVPTSSASGNGFLDSIEFTTINNPKWLTFDGVVSDLAIGDSVYIDDFQGRYRVSDGNIKFDGSAASWELCNGDTDADGLQNCAERYVYGTDPLNPDTDGDDLGDGAEVFTHFTAPTVFDTDEDGLGDGSEVLTYLTNPLDADTDDGKVVDGEEVARGTDPLLGADDLFTGVTSLDEDLAPAAFPVSWLKVDGEFMEPADGSGGATSTDSFRHDSDVPSVGDILVAGMSVQFNMAGSSRLLYTAYLAAPAVYTLDPGSIITFAQYYGKITFVTVGEREIIYIGGFTDRINNYGVPTPGTPGGNCPAVVHLFVKVWTEGNVLKIGGFGQGGTQTAANPPISVPLPVTPPRPLYFLVDISKCPEELLTFGTFRVSTTPGTYQGYAVTWIEVYNPDYFQILTEVPERGVRSCVEFGLDHSSTAATC